MKIKTILMTLALFVLAANAQSYYICTGDNVNIRKGPGTKYGINTLFNLDGKMNKGSVVDYLGVKRNGFLKVYNLSGGNGKQTVGWVSAKYLRPACEKCQKLNFHKLSVFEEYFPPCPVCGRKEICYDKDEGFN